MAEIDRCQQDEIDRLIIRIKFQVRIVIIGAGDPQQSTVRMGIWVKERARNFFRRNISQNLLEFLILFREVRV